MLKEALAALPMEWPQWMTSNKSLVLTKDKVTQCVLFYALPKRLASIQRFAHSAINKSNSKSTILQFCHKRIMNEAGDIGRPKHHLHPLINRPNLKYFCSFFGIIFQFYFLFLFWLKRPSTSARTVVPLLPGHYMNESKAGHPIVSGYSVYALDDHSWLSKLANNILQMPKVKLVEIA